MEIEESFRDLKSSRYGFGFENSYSQKINRIEILLLVAMLASLVAWLTGLVSEKEICIIIFNRIQQKIEEYYRCFFWVVR